MSTLSILLLLGAPLNRSYLFVGLPFDRTCSKALSRALSPLNPFSLFLLKVSTLCRTKSRSRAPCLSLLWQRQEQQTLSLEPKSKVSQLEGRVRTCVFSSLHCFFTFTFETNSSWQKEVRKKKRTSLGPGLQAVLTIYSSPKATLKVSLRNAFRYCFEPKTVSSNCRRRLRFQIPGSGVLNLAL